MAAIEFVKRAEATADRLRAFTALVDQLSWDLDAALSAVEKDRAGYRTRNAANPTGGANAVPGEVEALFVRAEAFLACLGRAEVEAFRPVAGFNVRNGAVTVVSIHWPTVSGLGHAQASLERYCRKATEALPHTRGESYAIIPEFELPARDGIG